MAVPAPDLSTMNIPQLLQALVSGMVGSPMHQQATFMLQFRIAEKQAEAAEKQAEAASQQANVSEKMLPFTRALVLGTWALFVVGGASVALSIVQVLISLKVIGK